MNKVGSKQIIPIVFIVLASVFVFLGVTKLGFWTDAKGPMPGFFPTIMGCVMVLGSVLALIQSGKEGKAQYHKDELLAALGAAVVIGATFIIGLIPSALLYVIFWLKFIEKESWINTLKVFIVITVIVIGVFVLWLQIPFPKGLLGEFIEGWLN